jgi:hypothetical protein
MKYLYHCIDRLTRYISRNLPPLLDQGAYYIASHLPKAVRFWVIVHEALMTAHEIHQHDLSEHPALADPKHPLHVHIQGLTWEQLANRLKYGNCSPIDRMVDW